MEATEKSDFSGIKHDRWRKIITITQLVLAGLIFLTEVVDNMLLYFTRSQGYGPDTIVSKLLRYLVLTSIINFGACFVAHFLVQRIHRVSAQKYILIITTEIICINVAFSHYQFATTFGIFVVPLILSILYEDTKLCDCAFGIGALGLTLAVVSRGNDAGYNKDIGPEAAIAYALLLGVFIFARICLHTLAERRTELDRALIDAERGKYLDKVEKMSMQTLTSMVQILDARDVNTNGHSFRVSGYATILARAAGLDPDEIEIIRQEALVHDVGKIGVPDYVLNKPSRLTDLEFDIMKTHTTVGYEITKNIPSLPNALQVAGSHHERFDGRGYPNGLAGKSIHPHARIVGIADAYDAMSSDRIYRKALSKEKIRQELVNGRGTQFDPDLLDIFLELFDSGKLDGDIFEEFENHNGNDDAPLPRNMFEDIESFIENVRSDKEENGINTVDQHDFAVIYDYVSEIKKRYNHKFEILMITMTPDADSQITDEITETAVMSMELAIKKNIRSTDVYTRYNALQHVIILTQAGSEDVEMVVKRILLDYYRFCDQESFAITYKKG